MDKPLLLHLFTPAPQASPFDVNMAYDAGYAAVIPYTGVTLADVANLTQDAIFSRGPKGVKRTGIFIGGRDVATAADMLDAARKSMFPPFQVSVFADPSGAYTTAAALIASVERALKNAHQKVLKGLNVVVLGGTGPVGICAAVLASDAGATVQIASHTNADRARMASQLANARYGASTAAVDASSAEGVSSAIEGADVILACAKAGVRVVTEAQLSVARKLLVAADINAVPPSGIEGVGATDDAVPLKGTAGPALGIGALAVGNIKYRVMQRMFESMLNSDHALFLDFRDAFERARELSA
ncbi:MAG: NAD(P)-dependent methylenetetrahydromethanopterin dehydrogenase [Burkholderiaceae bacterium]|jgi:methylene-tetrahydromethanopterin dehydrogenase